jgi:hypothetical protein
MCPTPTISPVPSSLSRPSPTPDSGNMIPLDFSPVILRRIFCSNAGNPLDRYGFPHSIDQYVDYSNLSTGYGAFIASLDSVSIPKCWQTSKGDPKWKAAMHEELRALDKNCT